MISVLDGTDEFLQIRFGNLFSYFMSYYDNRGWIILDSEDTAKAISKWCLISHLPMKLRALVIWSPLCLHSNLKSSMRTHPIGLQLKVATMVSLWVDIKASYPMDPVRNICGGRIFNRWPLRPQLTKQCLFPRYSSYVGLTMLRPWHWLCSHTMCLDSFLERLLNTVGNG